MATCDCGAPVGKSGRGTRLGLCPDCAVARHRAKQRKYTATWRANHGLTSGTSHRRAVLNAIGMMVEVAMLRKPAPARAKNPRYHGR